MFARFSKPVKVRFNSKYSFDEVSKGAIGLSHKLLTESKYFDLIEVRLPKDSHPPTKDRIKDIPTFSGTMFDQLEKHEAVGEVTEIVSSVVQKSVETNHKEANLLETLKGELTGSLDENAIKLVLEMTPEGEASRNNRIESLVYIGKEHIQFVNYADKTPAKKPLCNVGIDAYQYLLNKMKESKLFPKDLAVRSVNIVNQADPDSNPGVTDKFEMISDNFLHTTQDQMSNREASLFPDKDPKSFRGYAYMSKSPTIFAAASQSLSTVNKIQNKDIKIKFVSTKEFLSDKYFTEVPEKLSDRAEKFRSFLKQQDKLSVNILRPCDVFVSAHSPKTKKIPDQQKMGAFMKSALSGIGLVQRASANEDPFVVNLLRNKEHDPLGNCLIYTAEFKSGSTKQGTQGSALKKSVPTSIAKDVRYKVIKGIVDMASNGRIEHSAVECGVKANVLSIS